MQVGPEKSETWFFCHFGSSKIDRTHKHSNTCHWLNFHHTLILFLNARYNVVYRNQLQLKWPKTANSRPTIPLNRGTDQAPASGSSESQILVRLHSCSCSCSLKLGLSSWRTWTLPYKDQVLFVCLVSYFIAGTSLQKSNGARPIIIIIIISYLTIVL